MDVKIAYSTMIVRDMDETVKFYTEILGFKVDSSYEPKPGTRITLLKGQSETMLEIIEDKSFDIGLYSVGLDVKDLKGVVAELKAKGVKIITEITPTLVGYMAMMEDPNGIRYALIQHE